MSTPTFNIGDSIMLAQLNPDYAGAPGCDQMDYLITDEENRCTVVGLIGEIGHPRNYIRLLRLLPQLPEGYRVDILIDSPGGNLTTAIDIVTAMQNTKATCRAVGMGKVQSAGSFVFAFAPRRCVLPGAVFMYHGPILTLSGNSGQVGDYVTSIDSYTQLLLDRSCKLGIVTEEERQQIINDRTSIYLTGAKVVERIKAKETAQ